MPFGHLLCRLLSSRCGHAGEVEAAPAPHHRHRHAAAGERVLRIHEYTRPMGEGDWVEPPAAFATAVRAVEEHRGAASRPRDYTPPRDHFERYHAGDFHSERQLRLSTRDLAEETLERAKQRRRQLHYA